MSLRGGGGHSKIGHKPGGGNWEGNDFAIFTFFC